MGAGWGWSQWFCDDNLKALLLKHDDEGGQTMSKIAWRHLGMIPYHRWFSVKIQLRNLKAFIAAFDGFSFDRIIKPVPKDGQLSVHVIRVKVDLQWVFIEAVAGDLESGHVAAVISSTNKVL